MANINKEFIIQEKCWNIMQQFAGLAYDEDKNEISGLLCVKKSEHPVTNEPVYLLFDPVILEQENTGTTTELDGDAIRDYTIKAGMKYGKDIKKHQKTRNASRRNRCRTHNNANTFFSFR